MTGETFKRQLKMDGGFSSVSFICSKCDDISLVEAQDSLGLEDQMAPRWVEIDELEQKRKNLDAEIKQLKATKEAYLTAMTDSDEQLEVWDRLKDDAQEGKTVFMPRSATKKRKIARAERGLRKKQRPEDNDEDADFLDDSEESEQSEESEDETSAEYGDPLTLEAVNQRVTELRDAKKEARRERIEIDHKIRDVRAQDKEAK